MSELRKDPILGRWVVISIERGKRPDDFKIRVPAKKGGFCAFCNGNEYTTPSEIFAIRKDGSAQNAPGWTLRVVPNKFPALHIEREPARDSHGMYEIIDGFGAHEIIIESPDHNHTLSTMPVEYVKNTLTAYAQRLMDLKKDNRFAYVLIYKNEGDEAGATLEHTHSQLLALPVIPKLVQEEISNARNYHDDKKRCIFCDIIRHETADRKRIISENDHFLAIAPFASRSPFETWILPKNHEPQFHADGKYTLLAQVLQDTLKKIDQTLTLPPYNMVLHVSPFDGRSDSFYHWHIEIRPKLTKTVGFEWGSDFYINPTTPEDAAAFLRETKP